MLRTKPAPGKLQNGERVQYYHYDEFPEKTANKAKWQLIDALQRQQSTLFQPRASFDGQKNLYSPHKLFDDQALSFNVTIGRKEYPVNLKFAAIIDTGVLGNVANWETHKNECITAITLLNVVVRMAPATREGAVPSKQAFFLGANSLKPEGSAVEFWRGYFQSMRPTINGLILNVDTTVGLMFRHGPLLQALLYHLGVSDVALITGGNDPNRRRREITRFLKGLRVTFSHLRRNSPTKSIKELEWISARDYKFYNDKAQREMSVEDYFISLGYPLRYARLGALVKIGKAAYPLEVMEIVPGQPYRGLLPEKTQAAFLAFSNQKPDQRLRNIENGLKELVHAESGYIRNAQIDVGQSFISVDARVLQQPNLQAGLGIQIDWQRAERRKQKEGSWDMMRKTAHTPATIIKVFFVNTVEDSRFSSMLHNGELPNKLMRTWQSLGIVFRNQWTAGRYQGLDIDNYLESLIKGDRDMIAAHPGSMPIPKDAKAPTDAEKEQHKEWEAKMSYLHTALVVVFVRDNDKSRRECVKHWGDVRSGFPTQILKASKVAKLQDQYMRNVGLKINAKIKGINLVQSSLNRAVMPEGIETQIFGIDTAHPAPGSNFPTTAAVTYSIDKTGTNYRALVRFQEPRKELVTGVGRLVKEGIQAYTRDPRNGVPRRIIVYRDGVSEGQFQQVVDTEIREIWEVLDSMRSLPIFVKKNWPRPQLTFIVVGKRHHIRLLPDSRDQGNMQDDKRNALPGTVVDTDITTCDPKIFDFYLQSHGSLQGTSRPGHYSVLYDDADLSANNLESFSYDLCHVYQIATRSVSLPAPVYYADQVAARSAIHFYKVLIRDDISQRSSDLITFEDWKEHFNEVRLHWQTASRMYWL